MKDKKVINNDYDEDDDDDDHHHHHHYHHHIITINITTITTIIITIIVIMTSSTLSLPSSSLLSLSLLLLNRSSFSHFLKDFFFIILKVSTKYLKKSFKRLVDHLILGLLSDLARVRALFIWATSVDLQKLADNATTEPKPNSPLDYLLKIHWQLGNHANLFDKLCR